MNQQWVFGDERWLWAPAVLPALGLVLWFVWRRVVRRRLGRFVAARQLPVAVPFVRWYARGAKFALTLVALMLLAVAMARPLRGPISDKAQSLGVDFVIALDISKSMWVEDVEPNRLAAIKRELGEWLQMTTGDRVGLVLFAGEAFVQAPVTYDRVALNAVLQQAGPKSMSVGGTDIPKAVEMATHLLKTSESRSRCVVIITDGENLEGDAVNAVRDARAKEKLTVFTVGVGTISGGRVPAQDYATPDPAKPKGSTPRLPANKNYVTDEYGVGVTSRLDHRMLRQLADAGGGRYYEFRPGAQTFQVLRTQGMLPMIAKPATLDVRDFQEWYQLPLGAGIAALVAAALVPVRAKRPKGRPAAIDGMVSPQTYSRPAPPSRLAPSGRRLGGAAAVGFALLTLGGVAAPAWAAPWDDAEKLLAAKKPNEAVELMRTAVQTQPPDQYLSYNFAMTLYRAGRFEEAATAFEAVRQSGDNAALREKASVQAGNAMVQFGATLTKTNQVSGAILSLERSLGHYDESATTLGKEAAHNRTVAAARLEAILVQAGKKYVQAADASAANPASEETNLRNALQAYERVETLNAANADAPKQAAEIRKRLSANLSKQAGTIAAEAEKSDAAGAKPEAVMHRLEQALTKVDDALGLAPQDPAIEKQKQDIQKQASASLAKAAEKQAEKPLAKDKLNDSDQAQLGAAKEKLDQAVALDAENQKAKELGAKVAAKLEGSFVDRGKEALAAIDRVPTPQTKLAQGTTAANQFERALGINPENAEAKDGLAQANAKLPELYAAAGDAEAAAAKAAAGEAPPAKPQGKGKAAAAKAPAVPDLRKAIGHLEKADQDYGMALGLKPADDSLQQRAQAVRDALNAARDQLDQKSRAELAAAANAEGNETPPGQPNTLPEKPGEQPGQGSAPPPPGKKPLSMAELKQKTKPATGDNFWEKRVKDW